MLPGLIGSYNIISSTSFLACLHKNAQLHIVGAVKAQQVFVKLVYIVYPVFVQMQPVLNIPAVSRFIAIHDQLAGTPLYQIDVDDPFFDRLRR